MKRRAIATALLSFVLAVPAFAADGGQPQQGQGQAQTFEQRKAAILKNIEERLANVQDDKACIEAAKNDDDLKACREKSRARMEKEMAGRRPPRGGQRVQRGQGGQGQAGPGQGGPGGQVRQAPPPQDGGQQPN